MSQRLRVTSQAVRSYSEAALRTVQSLFIISPRATVYYTIGAVSSINQQMSYPGESIIAATGTVTSGDIGVSELAVPESCLSRAVDNVARYETQSQALSSVSHHYRLLNLHFDTCVRSQCCRESRNYPKNEIASPCPGSAPRPI